MRCTSRLRPCTLTWSETFCRRARCFMLEASRGGITFFRTVCGSFSGYSRRVRPASNLQDIVSYRERRGGSVRCARCGNENSEGNRFCGMCGTKLLTAPPVASAPAPGAAPRSSTLPSPAPSAPTPPQNPPAPRTPAPVSHDAPIISGPSFLGLNEPSPRKRASLSADPHAAPSSSNLDYLLEDEEEPRRGGGGKFILILLALALAVGFGYLRWKNQGLPWLHSAASKPPAADQ